MAIKWLVLPFATIDVVAGEMVMLAGVNAPVLFSVFPPPAPQPAIDNAIKTNNPVASLL